MAAEIDNCPQCGKIYVRNHKSLCPACIKDVDSRFEKCSAYLRKNRLCTMQELSEETGVSVRQITQFIREGRITVSQFTNLSIECESCGAAVKDISYILCEACRHDLAKDMKHVLDANQGKQEDVKKNKQSAFRIQDRLSGRWKD